GYALTSGHEAHAAETTNYDQLANLAQHNPSELNAHPVKAGAYDFSFVKDGFRYTFTSNGQNFTWKYIYTGEADSQPSTQGYTEGSTQAVSSN
ncbi:transglycosylase, partial [Staphylococcus epidermidis]